MREIATRAGVVKRARSERALTLIELLVVIVIIGLLVGVALPSLVGQTAKAQDSAAKQLLVYAYRAARLVYLEDGNSYPDQGPLVDRLKEIEPSVGFVGGNAYLEDKVSVERISAGEIMLRTRSRSGNHFRWHLKDGVPDLEGREWTPDVVSSTPAVNLFPFPSFELASLSGYTEHIEYGTDKGLELTTDWASSGQKSLHWWGAGSGASAVLVRFPPWSAPSNRFPRVEPNKTYTVSLDLRVDVLPPKDPYLKIIWGNTPIHSTEAIQIHEGVQRISLTATNPGATWASIDFGWDAGLNTSLGNNSFDFYFDSIRFSEGTDTDYFDGSFPHSRWLGDAHNSASEREGMDEQPADGQWRKW